jgi:BON domain-containing protein/EF hand domain-containing protein
MRALILLASILAATSALAQPAATDAPPFPAQPSGDFLALDRNRDGYISRPEAAGDKEIAKRFAYFDIDNDGRLSEREYAMAREDIEKRVLRDSVITARVKAALLAEKGIPSTAISVETYEGRVQLSGFVHSPDIVSRAGRVTANVNGVRTVHNAISVK